jgi:mRNA-degrading endonuclease RelE of RelBE toxin-antitoxin system
MDLRYSPAFLKAYAKLSAELRNRVDKQLVLLAENPHHPSLRTHKRQDEENLWQARITRNHRLYFQMDGDTIDLIFLGPHE